MKLELVDAAGNVVGYKAGTPEALAAWVEDKKPSGMRVKIVPDTKKLEFTRPLTRNTVRQKRNQLLAKYQWTVGADSPLTKQNQAEWLGYLKSLHRITKDLGNPANAVWPTEPGLEYDDA